MESSINRFERLVRAAQHFTSQDVVSDAGLHPFERRDIYPGFPAKVKQLFDDGHYAEATFEACKFIDKLVQKHSGMSYIGFSLMMDAFNEAKPKIQLTELTNDSEKDEQRGFKFIFAGLVGAIRNPRAHELSLPDDVDKCLDHLGFLSMLIRRLEQAGFK